MDVSRRKFFKICAGGMAGTTAAALGFAPKMALAQARNFKLLRAKEIRNTCTYCSVGCGLLMYSLGDGAKNAKEAIYHIEGDPDHPVSRGALCPKGAGLLDYVHSENRLRYPQYRAPGSDKWQRISWDEAFNRIARLMKADRDANFIEKNEQTIKNPLLHDFFAWYGGPLDTANMPNVESLFNREKNVIKTISQNESCVIVGRLANEILKNKKHTFNVFVSADENTEAERISERDNLSVNDALKKVRKVNRERADHCKYFTSSEWGNADNYDLCIKSDTFGCDESTKIIEELFRKKFPKFK